VAVASNYLLKARLTVISEQLDHEMQNGFRPGRSTADGIFNIKIVLRKMKEHGHACGCSCLT
jgi:hypothetical protein